MIKGVIFDMDGVISDTQIIHSTIESELLEENGINMSPKEITKKYSGVKTREVFIDVFKTFNKEIPSIEELMLKKNNRLDKMVAENIREIPGTREFIEKLGSMNIPLAVASASSISFIETVLSELKLRDRFLVITSAQEVKIGKPAPDIFLLAAERLSLLPEECIVIEDGINGMIAAKSAGMKCIALVKDKEQKYPADLVVSDLREVSIKELFENE